ETTILRNIEMKVRRTNGTLFDAEFNTRIVRDEQGKPQSLVTFVRDISEQKRAEMDLRSAEARYRTLIEQIPAVTYVVEFGDRNRATFVSPQIEALLGYSPEEWLADPSFWFERIHPDDDDRVRANLRQNAADPRALDVEYRMLARDGRVVWIHNTASRILELADWSPFSIGIMFDISARKQAEEQQQLLDAKLHQTQKLESLGILAGGIAHDFNNLLTGILGYADLALLELSPRSPARDLIEAAMNGTRRAAELTAQMLAYSGKGRFVVEPLDLSALIEGMTRLLDISISKKCVLKYDLVTDLPSIMADATQMRQVIMNLVINASEAIGERSGLISIATGAMHCDHAYLYETYLDEDLPEGLYVYMEVADNGAGMSEETRARIFEPFFTTKFTGRGLGLAAVLGIVRGHKGALKIYSEPGRGTTFKALFPATELPAAASEDSRSHATEWRGSGTVLVVDDEETVRGLVRRMLERMGFTVLTAADGREAVELFRANAAHIRLVLLDMTMPHMDGEETFRELRRIRGNPITILSSGYNEQTATSRFAGKGLAAFIQKPYHFEELRAIVRKALGGDDSRDE
ncbi:MAG TPA: PAS domain S-box protein, partial [Roseiflexaceae bacterium]|nr:PAS domain S-box protein [Roseiflexaceae bacterium]